VANALNSFSRRPHCAGSRSTTYARHFVPSHDQFQYWRKVLRAYGKTYANAASAPDSGTETIRVGSLRLLEIALVLVRLDYAASVIANADHSIM